MEKRARASAIRLWAPAIALGLLAACGGSNDPAAVDDRPDAITVEGLAFEPESLTVSAGTAITWRNEDAVRHTVTSGTKGEEGAPGVSKGMPDRPDGMFDGKLDETGASFSFTFDEAGTYEYFCRVHGGMTGVVVVE